MPPKAEPSRSVPLCRRPLCVPCCGCRFEACEEEIRLSPAGQPALGVAPARFGEQMVAAQQVHPDGDSGPGASALRERGQLWPSPTPAALYRAGHRQGAER